MAMELLLPCRDGINLSKYKVHSTQNSRKDVTLVLKSKLSTRKLWRAHGTY